MSFSGPTFGKAPSYTSDVQFGHTLSPSHTSISILFTDFAVKILPGGPPVAARSLTISLPVAGMVSESTLTLDVRGAIVLATGTNGTFVFRVLGESHVLDPLLDQGNDKSGNYTKSLKLKVPAGSENLNITLIIAIEQLAGKQLAQASLMVDSLDLAINP
jgi:hypothetical protein